MDTPQQPPPPTPPPPTPPLRAPRLIRYWDGDTKSVFLTVKAARDLDELCYACPSKTVAELVERAIADALNRVLAG